jgi:hypothetical protein
MSVMAHARTLAFAFGIALAAAPTACGPTPADVTAWETEDGGPEKLAAVVTNEKAPFQMRRDAGLALVRLERRGRRVGLPLLVDALRAMKDAHSRDTIVRWIVEDLAPRIENDHEGTGDRAATDAGCVLLSNELVAEAEVKARLEDALMKWLSEKTEEKLDDRSGRYSAEQIINVLAPKSLKVLFPVLGAHPMRRRAVEILARWDRETRSAALKVLELRIVELRTSATRDRLRREIEEANQKGNYKPTPEQVDRQVTEYRKNQIADALSGYARLAGGRELLLAIATDETEDASVRASALAAIHPDLDEGDEPKILVALISNEKTPDTVLDATYEVVRRSLKSEATVEELSKSKSWKARYIAHAVMLSKVKDASGIDAFMAHLPQKPGTPMGLEELRYYADEIELRFTREPLRPFLTSAAIGPKLVALIAFRGEETAITPAKNDATPLPTCESCEWSNLGLGRDTVGVLATKALMTRDGLDLRPPVDLSGLADPGPDHASQPDALQLQMLKALEGSPPPKHSPGGVKH